MFSTCVFCSDCLGQHHDPQRREKEVQGDSQESRFLVFYSIL